MLGWPLLRKWVFFIRFERMVRPASDLGPRSETSTLESKSNMSLGTITLHVNLGDGALGILARIQATGIE